MRLSIVAFIALSSAVLPVMSRPVSYQYARDYDDLLAREPMSYEELDERGLFGIFTHVASSAVSGIKHLIDKKKHKKKDLDELDLYSRDLDEVDLYAREFDEADLLQRDLDELELVERELPEDGLYEREYYDYEYY